MVKILLVGAGGFLGSVLRYLAGGAVQAAARHEHFPWGTLTVNAVGCLLIGFIGGLAETRHVLSLEQRLLLITGFLGGFTTFSAFSLEALLLVQRGAPLAAASYVVASITLCLAAAASSYVLMHAMMR